MKTIYKYQIAGPENKSSHVSIEMPINAQIKTVQMQGLNVCIWAIVDLSPHPVTEMRYFRILETGWEIEEALFEKYTYLGTVQVHGGLFIWHIFEEANNA
jgi:hypothetical protein